MDYGSAWGVGRAVLCAPRSARPTKGGVAVGRDSCRAASPADGTAHIEASPPRRSSFGAQRSARPTRERNPAICGAQRSARPTGRPNPALGSAQRSARTRHEPSARGRAGPPGRPLGLGELTGSARPALAPYRSARPALAPYRSARPALAPYRSARPALAPYRSARPAVAPYRSARPALAPYRSAHPALAPYRSARPATDSCGRVRLLPSRNGSYRFMAPMRAPKRVEATHRPNPALGGAPRSARPTKGGVAVGRGSSRAASAADGTAHIEASPPRRSSFGAQRSARPTRERNPAICGTQRSARPTAEQNPVPRFEAYE